MTLTKPQAEVLRQARENHCTSKKSPRGVYPWEGHGVRSNTGGSHRRMIERLAKDGYLTPKWPFHITDNGRGALSEFEARQWWNGHHYQAKAPHEC